MGSHAMQRDKMTTRSSGTVFAAALLSLFACGIAAGQVELTGSWAARNHEFLTGDGLPVDFT
jgi:hypothetical protein